MNYQKTKSIIALFIGVFIFSISSKAYDLVVAKDGSGNYTTVQAAINAAPNNSILPFTIFIKDGSYREKITVASNKTFIQLIGESVANTIVYYDDPATILGTQNSASFSINANDFSAFNITFANTFGDGSQAVAVLVNADRAAFKNCRFLGNQDTLYAKGSGTPRHYFYKCYIDGNVDYIFGSSIAVFDSCIIYSKARSGTGNSYLTAANTPNGQAYGYVFRDCFLPAHPGTTAYFLGRPWGNSSGGTSSYNKTVFLNSTLSHTTNPAGWSTWDGGTITSQITYAEYKSKNVDGTLANVSSRVAWSQQFTDADTVGYNLPNMFSGWSPTTFDVNFFSYQPADIAVSNFRAVKGTSSSQIDWNISWPMTGITYTLYRSDDNDIFSPIYTTTSLNDTAINFAYTDASLPLPGEKFYYYLNASKSGYDSHISDTLIISSKQTITTSALTISSFAQQLGTPTDPKSYTVSGVNLTGDITITPPVNFEVSSNNGSTWFTNTTPLVLANSGGVLATTTIWVRLNALANGDYSGNILHSSDNAVDVNVAVSGKTQAIVLVPITLIHWPLTLNHQNQDSAAGRNYYILGRSATSRNIALSDGVTVASVQPYSNLYGMAFNSGIAGTGAWGTGNGGNGSSLSRIHYNEFKIKMTETSILESPAAIRVDSIVTNFNFFGAAGSTSNLGYRLGVAWSRSNFTSDSSNVTSCDSSGVTGVPVTTSRTGGFTDYLWINTKSDGTGPVSRFAFTLNGATGVMLNPGDSITVRIYNSCGSTSTGRYGTLKNVMAKGVVFEATPVKLVSFSGGTSNGKSTLLWNVTSQENIKEYVIERSLNGTQFSTIGSIQVGNSNKYSFVDNQLNSGITYYRLKMVDISGKIIYSNVLRISSNNISFSINAYPNPFTKDVTISYPTVKSNALISIKSLDGKSLLTQRLISGTSTTTVELSNIARGTYYLIYQSEGEMISKKIIKK